MKVWETRRRVATHNVYYILEIARYTTGSEYLRNRYWPEHIEHAKTGRHMFETCVKTTNIRKTQK